MESGLPPLVQNAALLLAMAVVSEVVVTSWRLPPRTRPLILGILLGVIGVAILLSPWEPVAGIRLDARAVLLSVAGLVFGALPTLVAMGMTAAFRLTQGGDGLMAGIVLIFVSGSLGIAWRRLRRGRLEDVTLRELLALGLVVYAVLIVLVASLPVQAVNELVATMALPALIVYPAATVLLGRLLLDRLRRERAEAGLRAGEERLRLALTAAGQGLWELDVGSGAVLLDDGYARLLGHHPGIARETSVDWLDWLHPDDVERVQAAFRDYTAGVEPDIRLDFRLRTGSGKWRWIMALGEAVDRDADRRPRRVVGTFTDVTSLRKAEERARAAHARTAGLLDEARLARRALLSIVEDLRASEADQRETAKRYEGLVRHAPYAIFVNRDDRISLVNEACVRLFGATRPDELLGRSTDQHIHPDDRAAIREQVRALRERRQPMDIREGRIVRLDGRVVEVDVAASTFEEDGVVSIHVVLSDITERKRAEAEIRTLNADLERRVLERTAELEEAYRDMESFSYSVSHDLRAPLRAMTGFSSILSRRHAAQLDEEARHFLDNIVTAGEHMGVLIDDLLAYARLGRRIVREEPVPLAALMARLRQDLDQRISESGGRLEVDEPLVTPLGDQVLLMQALTNLVANALIYHRPGVPPHVRIGSVRHDGRVIVSVRDDGIGIPPEQQERIFDVFARLHGDDEFPGTGIGLAIVRKAARLMAGEITLESTPGSGSTFSLSLRPAPEGSPGP